MSKTEVSLYVYICYSLQVDSLQLELAEREGALERLSRESSRIQETNQKREDEKEQHLTVTENQLVLIQKELVQASQAISNLTAAVERKDEEVKLCYLLFYSEEYIELQQFLFQVHKEEKRYGLRIKLSCSH